MDYVLESDREFERLEFQATLPAYDFQADVADLALSPGARVLDAGCGSGVVARHLAQARPGIEVVGADVSAARLAQARQVTGERPNLRFDVANLLRLPYAAHHFDIILCRQVLQHLDATERQQALAELVRCLKPGGALRAVDWDGYLFGIYPAPPPVAEGLKVLRDFPGLDMEVGRKLPRLMLSAGLTGLDVRIEPLYMKADEVEGVARTVGWALSTARPLSIRLLGSEERALAFEAAYLDALRSPGAVFHCQKFVVTGRKPAPDAARWASA